MRIVQLLVLLVLLTACTLSPEPTTPASKPPSVSQSISTGKLTSPLEPRLWLVTDPATVLASVPDNPVPEGIPTAPPSGFVNKFVVNWVKTAIGYIARDGLPPTRAARGLMLISVALNDALIISNEAAQEGAINQTAVLAGAAWSVLRYLHPQHSVEIDQNVHDARWYGLWQRDPMSPVELERSFQIGRTVGEQVVMWAQRDGSDVAVEVALPAAGGWATDQLPLDAHWGSVKTVALPDGSSVTLPAPPAWDSSAMEQERTTFRAAQQVLTEEHRSLAWHWHADVGTATVPGIWFETAITTAVVQNLDELQTASLLAHLGVAMHDTAVACWYNKYLYGFARPEQWMNIVEPGWQPVLPTPPHPSYPSGHAAFSSAAANLLMVAFPQHKELFIEEAADATRSRIVGGVHWVMDGKQGMALGIEVARYVLSR
ncbi:vanadium-dependent haloperoxidase [Chloroflexus sp.]|uniref:vanadium-dependent haloperoxidase n=1 Tax=Chloroflexus sp. TaxID=1904827 RepID=UPI00404A270F